MSFIYRLSSLFNFWFAGLLLVLYLFLQKTMELDVEQHELVTWFIGFLILALLFIFNVTDKFKPNIHLKFIFSIPFYIALFYICEFTYTAILFFIGSVILCLGENSFSSLRENIAENFIKIFKRIVQKFTKI